MLAQGELANTVCSGFVGSGPQTMLTLSSANRIIMLLFVYYATVSIDYHTA